MNANACMLTEWFNEYENGVSDVVWSSLTRAHIFQVKFRT